MMAFLTAYPDGRIFKSLWIRKSHSEIPLFFNMYAETNLVLRYSLNIPKGKILFELIHFFQNQ